MRKFSLVSTTLVVVIFLSSCSRNTVNLDYTNAKEEVPALGNLVFRFDKSLVSDSLVNIWDTLEYIRFEPRIEGRFRWEHPDELVFSPSKPLPPATTFKATITSEVLQFSKFSSVGKADKISFSTAALKLETPMLPGWRRPSLPQPRCRSWIFILITRSIRPASKTN